MKYAIFAVARHAGGMDGAGSLEYQYSVSARTGSLD